MRLHKHLGGWRCIWTVSVGQNHPAKQCFDFMFQILKTLFHLCFLNCWFSLFNIPKRCYQDWLSFWKIEVPLGVPNVRKKLLTPFPSRPGHSICATTINHNWITIYNSIDTERKRNSICVCFFINKHWYFTYVINIFKKSWSLYVCLYLFLLCTYISIFISTIQLFHLNLTFNNMPFLY